MIITRMYIFLSLFIVLCVTIRVDQTKAQYHNGQGSSNHYGASNSGSYGGYGLEQSSEEVDERPKVQLGVRLKIPAIRFELPRVSLPKITVSAKIRQPDGPRVISLPEINLDTSSKVEPPGAQAASNQGDYYSKQNSNYLAQKQPYRANENVQTFSFSTQEENSAHQVRPSINNHGNRYRASRYRNQDYSSTNYHPSYWNQDQFLHNYSNNYHDKRIKATTDNYYHNMVSDADLGFNSPVYVMPGTQTKPQYSVYNQMKPHNHQPNLYLESGGRFKRNHIDHSRH